MQLTNFAKNIRLYPVYSAISFTPFMLPVLVLFWQENGLNTFEIFILQAIFSLAIVLLEIPTGAIADILGKKFSILLGNLLNFAGLLLYACSYSFVGFLISELVLALGIALLSGSSAAFLYDNLKEIGESDNYTKLSGKADSYQLIVVALCCLAGGIIGVYSFRLTMFVSILGPLCGFCIALKFDEILITEQKLFTQLGRYWALIRDVGRFARKQKLVLWSLLFSSTLSASCGWLLWLYQPYMKECNLPIEYFGVIFAGFNIYAGLISRQAHRIVNKLGKAATISLMMGLQILFLPLLVLFKFPFSFLFFMGQQTNRAFINPIINQWILDHTFKDKRATMLSLTGLGEKLIFAMGAPFIGIVGTNKSLDSAILAQVAILFGIFTILLITYQMIPSKYFIIKTSDRL